jgi:hypothetical protein
MDSNNVNPQGNSMVADDSTAPSSPSQIPDLMKIGASPVNTNMDVETDILDSVVLNETFCRFRLQNKGILHSNSKLTFTLDVADTTDNVFLPINIGINSLIERCVLKVGTKTVCETSDFNHFMAFRSTFINPQHNKHRECIGTGRQMCRKWEYLNGTATTSASYNTDISDTDASYYAIDTGLCIDAQDKGVNGRTYDIPEYLKFNSSNSASATKQSPVFQIALNDLFPFLKMNQLPLYLFKEEIDIELYFAPSTRRACISGNDVGTFTINRNEVKMIADYIFYPQEMMESYANANKQMSFTYVDYRLVKRTLDNTADTAQQIIYNVGGAGRVVNKLFFALENSSDSASSTLAQKSLFNYYTAVGIETDKAAGDASSNMGTISHNLRYNDKFLYPIDINNNARIFHNIALAEGSTPFISKDEFSREQGLISPELLMGRNLSTEASGNFYYTEDRLNRNERVNSRGIELYQTWNKLPAKKFTLRVWLEVVKMAVLDNGVLTIVYA